MQSRKALNIYIQHRDNEILGGLLATDDKQGLNVIISNLISDLSHSEAEIILLGSVNRNARNYAEKSIKSGNASYAEYLQNKQKVDD